MKEAVNFKLQEVLRQHNKNIFSLISQLLCKI